MKELLPGKPEIEYLFKLEEEEPGFKPVPCIDMKGEEEQDQNNSRKGFEKYKERRLPVEPVHAVHGHSPSQLVFYPFFSQLSYIFKFPFHRNVNSFIQNFL